jgi:hypothetical protein
VTSVADDHEDDEDLELEMHNFQDPQLSSNRRLVRFKLFWLA